MNIQVKPPVSILDPEFVYVPSDETNIAATFAREVAKMRTPFDVYDEVDRDHYLMFVNGVK